ncbi:type II toxin-antitoxin system PemK/MazF family toxin [Bradyrhizobium hereditatis]|uniref:type II toxin-antitoxin system PemK/MazF family toxin n=1 Tax=Bradyrhizobium hereditatis TaxID=2821405 RepID=UPI0035D5E8D5
MQPAAKPARSRLSSTTVRPGRTRRGEIWTVACGKNYAGKPRPLVIVQDNSFNVTGSITICAVATYPTDGRCSGSSSSRMGATAARDIRLMVDKSQPFAPSRSAGVLGRDEISYSSISEDGVPRHGRIT